MVINALKGLGVLALLTLSGISLAEIEQPSELANDSQAIATSQVARSFLIGSALIEASYEYYHYHKRCPDNLEALSFPSLEAITKEKILVSSIDTNFQVPIAELLLIDQLAVNNQCQISIRFKDKPPVAQALRGKSISVQLDATNELPKISCSFDGAEAYAPPSNCQFPATDAYRVNATDESITRLLYGLYSRYSKEYEDMEVHKYFIKKVNYAIEPLMEQLYRYYERNQQCPADNKDFLSIIDRIKQRRGDYINEMTLTGCQVTIKLADNKYIPKRLKGKIILVDKQQGDELSWGCTVPEVDSIFVPKECFSY